MSYENLSKFYDLSIEKETIEKWNKIISKIIDVSNTKVKNILELGCGTGNITVSLLDNGYEIVGIDNCEEMLSICYEKTYKYGNKIFLLNQDINKLDLDIYEIDMILAANDVINYLDSETSLLNLFSFANKHLKQDGILLFDYSSEYKFEKTLDGNVFVEDLEEYYYIWKNFYDKKNQTLEINIDIFELNDDKTYNRYEDNQIQKTYSENYIRNLLEKSGFERIISFSDFDMINKNFEKSDRIFFYIQKGHYNEKNRYTFI